MGVVRQIAGFLLGREFASPVVIPVIRLSGAIGMATPLRPGLSLAALAGHLDRAFEMRDAPAVALIINSPGGSPVQSRLIFTRIRALAEEKKKKVLVFIEDVAASGGYMLALAGDEINADPSSIVGSIGVITAGFGLDKAITKLGIERRVYTAGEFKMSLDPFQPEKPDEVIRLKELQKDIHADFIAMVKARRGDKLKGGDGLFTGEIWSGNGAVANGLIDGLTDLRARMRFLYGEKVKLVLVNSEGGFLRRLFRLPSSQRLAGPSASPSFADDLARGTLSAIEERAIWARFGF